MNAGQRVTVNTTERFWHNRLTVTEGTNGTVVKTTQYIFVVEYDTFPGQEFPYGSNETFKFS